MRYRLLLAAVLLFGAMPAVAQDALPTGIVDDPCVGAPVVPASVLRYFTAALEPAAAPVARPTADLAAYAAAQDRARPRDWADLCHYRAANVRLAAQTAPRQRIVYLGDSITELWGLADPAFFAGDRVDRGISGQTTAQMLLRFQADVIALHPAIVHILGGSNDVAGNTGPETEQDVRNNIIAMVTLARANHIRVVLGSIPPADHLPWRPALKPAPQIRALNAWLRSYARSIGAVYVDYYRVLATPAGGMQPGLTLDGVHPNGRGYQAMTPLSRAATR